MCTNALATCKSKLATTSIQNTNMVILVAVVHYTLHAQFQSIVTQLSGKNPRDPSSNLVPFNNPTYTVDSMLVMISPLRKEISSTATAKK